MMSESSRASQTLKRRYGDCGTKTNLQIALLRGINIPARYHIASLRKEGLKDIISESAYKFTSDIITHHPWCECYLSERWISCDTLFDKALALALYENGIRTKLEIPTIDWDGENDLNTATTWMIEDKGTFPSIDDLFIESEKELEKLPIEKDQIEMLIDQSNKYTDNLRKL
jgi:transglutaminase-like putative cysteine protease